MKALGSIADICRWTARILGTSLVLMSLALMIGEGIPNPFNVVMIKQLELLTFAISWIGILVGWRKELAGGILSLGGSCAFILCLLLDDTGVGNTQVSGYILIFLYPGALYIVSSLLRGAAHVKAES